MLHFSTKPDKPYITIVARVRRRGDRPPHSCGVGVSGKCEETGNSCLLSVEKNEIGVAT